MRVLFLADSLANGGAERQLALLVKNLPAEWESRVWSLGRGAWAEDLREAGIPVEVHSRAWRWDITPAFHLWSLIRRWKPDVVHSWGWMGSMAAGPICAALHIPLVDGAIRSGALPLRRRLPQRMAMGWAALIVANSRAGLDAWGIGPHKGRVVHNAFDPNRLKGIRLQGHLKDRRFTVIMTGRMAPEKDYESFFGAARFLGSGSNGLWRFLAVGDGPERSTFQSMNSDLVKDGGVEFPEPGVEILNLVGAADVGVLMTNASLHAEGCSNSILEYMACGLPVVCSEGGGNRELVADGEAGVVVRPADPVHLAGTLLWLKENPDIASRLGDKGRAAVGERFTVERMVSDITAIYSEVLGLGHEQ